MYTTINSNLNMTKETFTKAEAEAIATIIDMSSIRGVVVKLSEDKKNIVIWAENGMDLLFAKLTVFLDTFMNNIYVWQREADKYYNPFEQEREKLTGFFKGERFLLVVKSSTIVDSNNKSK